MNPIINKQRWKYISLGDVATEISSRARDGEKYKVFSVTKHNGFVPSNEYFNKQVFSRDISNYKIVYPEQFAYATIHLDEGAIALLKNDSPVLISPMYTVFEVNKNIIHKPYLIKLLKSPEMVHRYSTLGSGSVHRRKAISFDRLASVKIPLPPIMEQMRIADILDKVDAIRQKRQQAIKLADDLLRAAFLDMFGDPVINPKSFNLESLYSLYSTKKPGTKCGPFGSALKKHEYVKTGISVWTMDNIEENKFIEEGCLFITEDKFEELEAYAVEENDILISRAGTVGKMCIAKPSAKKSIISTNLIRLSLDSQKIEPTYFVCLMSYFKGKVGRLKTGEDDAYSFMNTGILNQLSIPLPPISLQKKYTDIVIRVKQMQDKKYNSLSGLDELFNSITQRAFRGEL